MTDKETIRARMLEGFIPQASVTDPSHKSAIALEHIAFFMGEMLKEMKETNITLDKIATWLGPKTAQDTPPVKTSLRDLSREVANIRQSLDALRMSR